MKMLRNSLLMGAAALGGCNDVTSPNCYEVQIEPQSFSFKELGTPIRFDVTQGDNNYKFKVEPNNRGTTSLVSGGIVYTPRENTNGFVGYSDLYALIEVESCKSRAVAKVYRR